MPGLRNHLSFVVKESRDIAVGAENTAGLLIPSMSLITGISNGELLEVSDWEVTHFVRMHILYTCKRYSFCSANKAEVLQICTINPRSQSPTQVCLTCFSSNPHALWLAWLVCTNEEEHKSHPRVTAVAEYTTRNRKLVRVRPVPATVTRHSEVMLCEKSRCYDACIRAHSNEERDYWMWELTRRIHSQVL